MVCSFEISLSAPNIENLPTARKHMAAAVPISQYVARPLELVQSYLKSEWPAICYGLIKPILTLKV